MSSKCQNLQVPASSLRQCTSFDWPGFTDELIISKKKQSVVGGYIVKSSRNTKKLDL